MGVKAFRGKINDPYVLILNEYELATIHQVLNNALAEHQMRQNYPAEMGRIMEELIPDIMELMM